MLNSCQLLPVKLAGCSASHESECPYQLGPKATTQSGISSHGFTAFRHDLAGNFNPGKSAPRIIYTQDFSSPVSVARSLGWPGRRSLGSTIQRAPLLGLGMLRTITSPSVHPASRVAFIRRLIPQALVRVCFAAGQMPIACSRRMENDQHWHSTRGLPDGAAVC